MKKKYRICSKTVMDTSDPDIEFDEKVYQIIGIITLNVNKKFMLMNITGICN